MLQWDSFTSFSVFCNGSRLEPEQYFSCFSSFGSQRARVRQSLFVGQTINHPFGRQRVLGGRSENDPPANRRTVTWALSGEPSSLAR